MTSPAVTYSIIIPVFNSVDSLFPLVERLEKVFTGQIMDSYEIILVDDGSSVKSSWEAIERLAGRGSYIRGIQLMRNFGKNGALLCGFQHASGKYIITMDDDLQHLPEHIPALLRKKEHDIVLAAFPSLKVSFIKKLTSRINSWFETRLIGKPPHIRSSPFRLLKREVVEAMMMIRTPYPSIPALMYYTSRDVVNVEVSHEERKYGQTGFTWRKMGSSLSNMVINNSSLLLKLIALAGMIISVLSFGMGIFYIIKKLTVGTSTPGWASIIVTILFIGGLILFSVGVVGEYLIRIINGVEQKPSYIVRKKTGEANEN